MTSKELTKIINQSKHQKELNEISITFDFSHLETNIKKKGLASPFVYKQSQEQTHGIGNKDLGLTRMIFFAIPLPPLEEQKVIVEKVDALMALCDELEQQVSQSKTQVEELMQSCLREVLEE